MDLRSRHLLDQKDTGNNAWVSGGPIPNFQLPCILRAQFPRRALGVVSQGIANSRQLAVEEDLPAWPPWRFAGSSACVLHQPCWPRRSSGTGASARTTRMAVKPRVTVGHNRFSLFRNLIALDE